MRVFILLDDANTAEGAQKEIPVTRPTDFQIHLCSRKVNHCAVENTQKSIDCIYTHIYCDVFGRMPSLLCNRKINTSMDTLTTRYCRVAWLLSNRGWMVTWIRSPILYCCVHVCCIATNSGKASVSIGTARCCKGKAIHNSQLVSLWKRKKLVFGSGRS
jgi:hypothetical protein